MRNDDQIRFVTKAINTREQFNHEKAFYQRGAHVQGFIKFLGSSDTGRELHFAEGERFDMDHFMNFNHFVTNFILIGRDLEVLHRERIVYGDIKTDNLVWDITLYGERGRLLFCDGGSWIEDGGFRGEGLSGGTRPYYDTRNQGPIRLEADVKAFALMVLEVMCAHDFMTDDDNVYFAQVIYDRIHEHHNHPDIVAGDLLDYALMQWGADQIGRPGQLMGIFECITTLVGIILNEQPVDMHVICDCLQDLEYRIRYE